MNVVVREDRISIHGDVVPFRPEDGGKEIPVILDQEITWWIIPA